MPDANMIVHSFSSLGWVMVLLLALLYIFAVVLTQGVTDFLSGEDQAMCSLPVYVLVLPHLLALWPLGGMVGK